MARSLTSFSRSGSDRILAGVAGGLGARIRVEPSVIRLAFIVLALAGGTGIVLYLLLWLISGDPVDTPAPERRSDRRFYALWLIVFGSVLLIREFGPWPGDPIMWSASLGGFGSGLLWSRGDDGGRLSKLASRIGASPAESLAGMSRSRIGVGALLVLGGMATFVAANTSLAAVRNVAFAVGATIAGLALIFGPWVDGLIKQLRTERYERVRLDERAEVAAHLHDSVLQTFALIQRSNSPAEMASLARVQERELRAWLYGRAMPGAPTMLSDALDAMAGRIERQYHVAVESVLVGDAELDDATRALVDAAGEAVTNAAKHAGVGTISVYCEVDPAEITLYVRDEGAGFDAEPAADRRGIADSIVGRMERNGGVATIRSRPHEGTEVHLALPRRRADV